MRTLGIRELRERSATFIKRAGAGEQMIITVSGEPIAMLGPLTPLENRAISLMDLINNGSVIASSSTPTATTASALRATHA